MGQFVICRYQPKPGKEGDLLAVVRDHIPILDGQGLVTGRAPCAMRAADGSIIEVFEWKSEQAVKDAHENPVVREMWSRFEQCCTCETLAGLPECQGPFPHFDPVEL